MVKVSERAFTLAELLIALVVLSVIVTFSIPKILSGFSQSAWNAILKEDISTISELTYEAVLSKAIPAPTGALWALYPQYSSYILSRLNAVKQCSTNHVTQGCLSSIIHTDWGGTSHAGAVLSNGSVIVVNSMGDCRHNSQNTCIWIAIDANGDLSPNSWGRDKIALPIVVALGNPYGRPGRILDGNIYYVGDSVVISSYEFYQQIMR